MKLRNFATRLSCFSLVSAIETDLRNFIEANSGVDDIQSLFPEDVSDKTKERYFNHNKEVYISDADGSGLLEYLDFSDLCKLLNKIKDNQSILSKEEVSFVSSELDRLTQTRNRVCHSRPLEPNDFNDLLDFSNELRRKGNSYRWLNITSAINKLEDPTYTLLLDIPSFWRAEVNTIFQNLPLPEFDDTGFIGRKKDRDAINKLLFSNTKVISIVGEGGIGKTALAMRCLYDTLEVCETSNSDRKPFDMILWVSLKVNRLTVGGIVDIRDSISSTSGMLRAVNDELSGGVNETEDSQTLFEEIKEYMAEFNILLCIDNLETISSDEIRDFISDIPGGSKVLITTRVGLGEIEYRYKLEKLEDTASINLMRSLAKLLNCNELAKRKNESLRNTCLKLYNNPLLIKWYVLCLASGKSVSELLNKEGNTFETALNFCFSGLYDKLSSVDRKVISVIACIRKPVSPVELRFIIDDVEEVILEESLNTLKNTSMMNVSSTGTDNGRTYLLTDIAEQYIQKNNLVSQEVYKMVKSKRKQVQEQIDKDNVKKAHYMFDVTAVRWNQRDEQICSIFLKKAMLESKSGNQEKALELISKAKSIMPEFSECYRISGLINRSNPFQAETEFEKALEFDPHSSIALYNYAQFLDHEEEFDRSIELIDRAIEIEGEQDALMTFKAKLLMILGQYKSASSLYEKLLQSNSSRLRKFRISTYDQAASCYRRMAEQSISDRDFAKAEHHLERALEIANDSFCSGDFDKGIVNRLYRILLESNRYSKVSGDHSVTNKVFSVIDSNMNLFSVEMISAFRASLEHAKIWFSEQSRIKIDQYLLDIEELCLKDSDGRIFGTIDNLVDKHNSGVSFGFVVGVDGLKYFFPRVQLIPNDVLDEYIESDSPINVTFIPSTSEKGPTALSVKKVF